MGFQTLRNKTYTYDTRTNHQINKPSVRRSTPGCGMVLSIRADLHQDQPLCIIVSVIVGCLFVFKC
jgi:hypothetical protein